MNDRRSAFIGAHGSRKNLIIRIGALLLLSVISFVVAMALHPVHRLDDLRRSSIRPQYAEVQHHRSVRGRRSSEIIIHTEDRSYILRDIVYHHSYDEHPIVAALIPGQPCIIWTERSTTDYRPYVYGIVTPTIGIDPSIGINAYNTVRQTLILIIGLGAPFIAVLIYRAWSIRMTRKALRRR